MTIISWWNGGGRQNSLEFHHDDDDDEGLKEKSFTKVHILMLDQRGVCVGMVFYIRETPTSTPDAQKEVKF